MKFSIPKNELLEYSSHQLNTFFPDNNKLNLANESRVVDLALERLEHCFKHVAFQRYHHEGQTLFNHLYADHYLMYLWFLSNTFWRELDDDSISSKFYYLNKSLHGLDCMYNTGMPDIFLVFHGVGTMLGKGKYADYFVALQGCTVGSHKGDYPVFGKGVALTANSSVIGKCNIGNRCTIATRTTLFQKNLPDDHTAFIDFDKGQLQIRQSEQCYAQQFFITDLSKM